MSTPSEGTWTYFTWRGCPKCGVGVDLGVTFRVRDGVVQSKCGCGHERPIEPHKLAPPEGIGAS